MTQPSRLDDPEILAVLEANRAKLVMMQQQQQQQRTSSQQQQQPNIPAAVGLPKPPMDTSGRMRSNPVFGSGDDATANTANTTQLHNEYIPALAAAMRTPPISTSLSADAGLPPVGDLFSPEPALPVNISTTSTTPASADIVTRSLSFTTANTKKDSATDTTLPQFASWDVSRPFLSGRFLYDSAASTSTTASAPPPLESYPPQAQESMLVDDLLYVFGGFEGTWIKPEIVQDRASPTHHRLRYHINARGQIEPALLEMATRMLPLCEYVSVISRYSELRRQYPWGLVCQALGGAMRSILLDWDLMLAQLEHQLHGNKLTLQALWYYVQPPMSALRLVAGIAAEASARRLRGASLLSMLHTKAGGLMGDATAHRLVLRLLRAASEPYFAQLWSWVGQGVVDDPYDEFMIVEDKGVKKDDLSVDGGSAFWSERFTLRPAIDPFTGAPSLVVSAGGSPSGTAYDVPVFLERIQHAILDTGRYIDLVRSCSSSTSFSPVSSSTRSTGTTTSTLPKLEYDEGGKFVLVLEQAHKAAAASALSLMRHEIGVSRGLLALKRYFLAAQGDLFLSLMEIGDADLNADCGKVPLQQLQAVLDIAIRSSSAAADPAAAARLKAAYDHRSVLNLLIAITQTAGGPTGPSAADSPAKKPRLRPVVPTPMTAAERSTVGRQRRARESFMLSYEVPWPLSVVVPDAAMAQYQMIFRHVFELKWVERELNRVCSMYQKTRPLAIMQRRAAGPFTSIKSGGRASTGGSATAVEAAVALSAASPPPPSAVALGRAYRTCQLMTHFFRQYLLYATFEVLEPLWQGLEADIERALSVDEIVEVHRTFLRRVMKGLLLSRKVVVLRSLLSLKQLALEFVAASVRFVDLDWEAMEEEQRVSSSDGNAGASTIHHHQQHQGKSSNAGTAAAAKALAAAALKREQRLEKEARVRAALDEALSNPEFSKTIRDLRSKFEARCGDFVAALSEAHRQARSERTDTREELEGLLNLMGRLDFNGYFEKAGLVVVGNGGGGGVH